MSPHSSSPVVSVPPPSSSHRYSEEFKRLCRFDLQGGVAVRQAGTRSAGERNFQIGSEYTGAGIKLAKKSAVQRHAGRCNGTLPVGDIFNVLWCNVSQLSKSTNHEHT